MTPPLARRLHRAAPTAPRCAVHPAPRRRPIPPPRPLHRLTAQLRRGLRASGEHLADRPSGRHRHLLSELLRHGLDPATRDLTVQGWSALHWAAQRGHWLAAKTMLCLGTDPDVEDDLGRTPLHVATHKTDCRTTDRLIRAGANPHARSSAGETPLHEAASYNNGDGVALLLAAGADPNATDNSGNTPLHMATRGGPPWHQQGHAACILLLLEAGANPERRNHRGEQPRDNANDYGNPALAVLLSPPQHPAGEQPKEVTR